MGHHQEYPEWNAEASESYSIFGGKMDEAFGDFCKPFRRLLEACKIGCQPGMTWKGAFPHFRNCSNLKPNGVRLRGRVQVATHLVLTHNPPVSRDLSLWSICVSMYGYSFGGCICELQMFRFRDVSSVELLMNNHQGIKAEIDARNDSFTTCIELGKSLLARKHYASEEVWWSL